MKFQIELLVTDEFGDGLPNGIPNGILSISRGGNTAIVDKNIFNNKQFYKPLKFIIDQNKSIKDISSSNLYDIVSKLGECNSDGDGRVTFDPDNQYDLDYIWCNDKRISINYRNCPINSFYLLDEDGYIKVILSQFNKSYYVVDDLEWYDFVKCLNELYDLSTIRDNKINDILGDKTTYANITRQLSFFVEKKRSKSNKFLDSVYSYYEKNRFITEKQAKKVSDIIWD